MPAAGSRPDRLAGVRPQERVQQHLVDQFVDTVPALPILDVPVPLMGEQLVDVLRFFDTLCPVAEQVIDVPKIILEDIPARRLCREPQLVEQLVDEPVPSFDDFDLVEEEEEEEEQPRMVPGSRVRDAHGRSWCRVAGGGVYWWMIGTSTAQYTPSSHSPHPPRRGSPPGQGGIQILAIVVALVGDVLQQFFEFFRSSSSTEWWTFQLCSGNSGRKLWRLMQLPWGRAMLCSTVATYSASVQGRLLEVFQVFYVSG